ncbi:MAG: deoxyguanosinetriphosphate triphosphohydrolase [Candidatus Dactylopiibacterium carminicum]|uniref:Deoxyguanosinetriphosphate triphosphohydrolase-like protein n=1 Tax=Candidatus Dactylopiibacterium carminicum TaxID=857335 RepID=A0A272ERM0_9RHOO|nr:deoxyguanosinetriphosphate triphosphohydrolase [Candidatus Dactylopiibacterium carminicum]KAF7598607.1 deoxyguanosinetriphosphate triphosphohydrolase [Candidatus Dactylopiibacterium carminicum]PAS92360.1 MAG: deoxyguanosinetriphosphate triphosphohydrolase [Candidatus Dactylopiibacterium carminicum]PAS95806.1 MAG: deoxyguanosinetriphosphate triphosphohydrolase [Candidatus Dactylopiibacterium carminicum]PAS98373.1 MAG: deoxyguanosinetriphosphate triphosphohydrolase [Candidatus Dactylopiibacter
MADTTLASYGVTEANSRGRRHAEPAPETRSEFQRDRDRIIHCNAFRRLEYKTQVFVNHEGDLFRTRLTHSIEVAQIGRSLARALSLNEDLVEAIALSHDLGHTPFGHAGQDALNECMGPHGGFEHNLQSLRIVDRLEERYATFDGLNLMHETREGILKHCSLPNARQLGELGARFLEGRQPSLEAQLCNLADAIAYNNHDVDDGLRAGLISLEQLEAIEAFARPCAEVRSQYPDLTQRRLIHETVRRMINAQAIDLITQTRSNLTTHGIASLADVHAAPPLIAFSLPMQAQQQQLQRFLREQLYWHYQVLREMSKAKRIIRDLFTLLMDDPRLLPPQHQEYAHEDRPRAIADYIAGMTDRYALKEHRRLFALSDAQ